MALTTRSASCGNLPPAEPCKPLVVSVGEPKLLGLPLKYVKSRFLGKGGFAKVYEVRNAENNEVFAAKIVTKSAITKQRTLDKLKSEIAIHRSLQHESVAQFVDCVEDGDFVYIILEMCPNQTLNELMRKRPSRRLSEPEAMFYVYELIVALKYLHKRRVLHRDLKLGNLFLDDQWRLKVGDFGLAAQLSHDREKRRTICGTPNYIAPEILEGKYGHSYEVDIWSLGVVLYTLVFGRPPFETSDVKSTYRRIRDNRYTFPDHVAASTQVKEVVSSILKTDPRARPSLDKIVASPWFHSGQFPPTMPSSIASLPSAGASPLGASPRPSSLQPPFNASARSETPERGEANFARIDSPASRMRLRDRSPGALGPPYHTPSWVPSRPASATNLHKPPVSPHGQCAPSARLHGGCGRPPMTGHRDQENMSPNGQDFASACQGFLQQENQPPQAPSPSPRTCDGKASAGQLPRTALSPLHPPPLRPPSREPSPLGQPSARVPARMMGFGSGVRSNTSSPRVQHSYSHLPLSTNSFTPNGNSTGSTADTALGSTRSMAQLSSRRTGPFCDSPLGGLGFDNGAGRPPPVAPSARTRERCHSSPHSSPTVGTPPLASPTMPELWVTKWVDYSNKYGVGYMLSNGCIGVYFNDSTKIVLLPDGNVFDYVTRRRQDKPEVYTTHSFASYPEDLKKKVTLLKHFKNYMTQENCERKDAATMGESRLGPCPTNPAPVCRDGGQVPFVKKCIQNNHATLFQLSNKIVQVVFFDRTEAILSSKANTVTYFDKKQQVSSYPLSNVLDVPSPELAKRLRYIKDVLVNLLGARTEKG